MIRLRIGDILLEQGVITREQLERALEIQKQTNQPIGEILIKNGWATEEQLTKAFSRQFGLPYASRANGLLALSEKENLKTLVTEEYARGHALVPLFARGETMGLAVADPMDVITLDNLRISTGKNLVLYLATKSEILAVQDELYSGVSSSAVLADIAKQAATSDEVKTAAEGPAAEEEKADLDKSAQSTMDEGRVVQLVNQIIRQAIEEKASDIHIEPMEDLVNLRFRIDGVLHEKPPPGKALAAPIVARIKILSKLNVAERRLPQDGSFTVRHRNNTVDIRVSTCPTVWGEKVVMRILNKQAVNLDVTKLGFEPKQQEDFLKAAGYPHGLILLTGPTGSGKTTTLYSVLKAIQSPDVNIMTIEDPVEFQIRGINQVQVKPQIGLNFAAALRSFLRQDPDIILVGEIRDQETAELCMRAALTGHLVLSTLHTNSALEATIRLNDMGIEKFLISTTVVLVAAQRLVRVLCPDCKEPYKPQPGYLKSLGFEEVETLYKPKGCMQCSNTGYRGRKAVYEVILLNEDLRSGIQKGLPMAQLYKIARASGFDTIQQSGFLAVKRGLTSLEEFMSMIFVE